MRLVGYDTETMSARGLVEIEGVGRLHPIER